MPKLLAHVTGTPVDPAAGTAGVRTLGAGAQQACAGNDARLSDSRAPSGTAGGALNGTYPNPALDVVPWAPVALTDAATIAIDASLGNHFRVTLAGNRTLGAPTNPTDGQRILVEVAQDATGGRTLAYDAVYAFGTDVVSPTLTTTANKVDYLGFVYSSATVKWRCLAVARGY